MRRLLAVSTVAAVLLGLQALPAAALIIQPQRVIEFTVAVTGTPKPYKLHLKAQDVGSGANDYLDVQLSRTSATVTSRGRSTTSRSTASR